MARVLITALFTWMYAMSWGQTPSGVMFSCIQVNGAGIDVNWLPSSNPGGNFVAYHVFASDNSGAFIEVASFNTLASSNFTYVSGNPSLYSSCFYITTEYSIPGGTDVVTSPTFCSSFLDAAPSAAPPGFAELTWNDVGGNFLSPVVYLEYPAGTWNPIDTLAPGTTSYSYEVTICGEQLNFQIHFIGTGCEFTSNVAGDFFVDQTPPAIPTITSVTVNPATGRSEVHWNVNSSGDTDGYIVYACNGSVVSLIDTVFGINSTTFVDLLSTPSTGPECYLLSAIDTCYSGFPPSPNTSPTASTCNCTIFLQPTSYTLCSNSIPFTWSAYSGWNNGVERYILWYSTDAVNYTPVDTVDGNTTATSHDFISINSGTNYYYISAESPDGYTSLSNVQTVSVTYANPPTYFVLAAVNTITDNEIGIDIRKSTTSVDHTYILERKNLFSPYNWEIVTSVDDATSLLLTLTDNDVHADVNTYEYRVILKNPCGTYIDTTLIGRNIVLTGENISEDLQNKLQWTTYGNWACGVEGYELKRSVDGGPFAQAAWLLQPPLTDLDSLDPFLESKGYFCYRAVAHSNEMLELPGEYFTATSNEVCLTQDPLIWVPNAFVVDGANRYWHPVISFADTTTYHMYIYSRWSNVIFDNTQYSIPWDGTMNGEYIHEDSYVYHILIKDGRGALHERRGNLILLNDREQ
jgi:gliding motility-associated-like protein